MSHTWLPEKRAKYNAKRRQKDLDYVYSNWNLPRAMTETKINIAEVPRQVAKKHKRAIAVHGSEWTRDDAEYCSIVQEIESRSMAEAENYTIARCTSTIEQMGKVLPTYQSRTIVDIPSDFRKFRSKICEREISGSCSALNYLFWNNYRLALHYNSRYSRGDSNNNELSLHHVNEALSLLPTLQRGEIPHYDEVLVRTVRACATFCRGDIKAALVEYRVCLAAIRLLHSDGKIDMNDACDKIMDYVNTWPHTIIRMTIRLKIQDGVRRPYLTKDEYLDLMKEHAYGIYAPSSQKCFHCGKTDKLLLCSGCNNAWYCSKGCAAKAWKLDHKHRCGSKKYSGTMNLHASSLQLIHREIDRTDIGYNKTNSLGMSMMNVGDRDFLVLCKDPSSGEIFDALTDETIQLQEGTPWPAVKSKLGGYHVFGPDGVPEHWKMRMRG